MSEIDEIVQTPDEWTPTPDEVARLLRARTKDANGAELGEWTDETRPTLDEVEGIIEQAIEIVAATTGRLLAEPCASGAHQVAGLLAAMLVELSYFPEQVRNDRSAYAEYKRLYDDGIAKVVECVEAGGGAASGGEGFGYHNLPVIPETTFAVYGGSGSIYGPWGDVGSDDWPEAENPANWRQTFKPPSEPPEPGDLPVGDLPASGEDYD
jgi:hypothetical protein